MPTQCQNAEERDTGLCDTWLRSTSYTTIHATQYKEDLLVMPCRPTARTKDITSYIKG